MYNLHSHDCHSYSTPLSCSSAGESLRIASYYRAQAICNRHLVSRPRTRPFSFPHHVARGHGQHRTTLTSTPIVRQLPRRNSPQLRSQPAATVSTLPVIDRRASMSRSHDMHGACTSVQRGRAARCGEEILSFIVRYTRLPRIAGHEPQPRCADLACSSSGSFASLLDMCS